MNVAELLPRVSPGVVTIISLDADGEQTSQGSGFIVTADGVVVTAWHVVGAAAQARVKLSNGTSYEVEGLMEWDEEADFALLKIEGNGLPTLPLGDSDTARQGDQILTLSAPLGLEQTASEGMVSAVREWSQRGEILQLTAPISPGSSGGPVLDAHGDAVGIISFLMWEGQNLNFAVPVNRIKPGLQARGRITHFAALNPETLTSAAVSDTGSERFRLSRAALETLAVVAYKQPVTRSDIAEIRGVNGVNVDAIMDALLKRKLVRECERRPGPGQRMQYVTTEHFLTHLGLNSLQDLPNLDELGGRDGAKVEGLQEPANPDLSGVEILYVDLEQNSSGGLEIKSELRNQLDFPVVVNLLGVARDSEGKVVRTREWCYGLNRGIPPGGTCPLDLHMFFGAPDDEKEVRRTSTVTLHVTDVRRCT